MARIPAVHTAVLGVSVRALLRHERRHRGTADIYTQYIHIYIDNDDHDSDL